MKTFAPLVVVVVAALATPALADEPKLTADAVDSFLKARAALGSAAERERFDADPENRAVRFRLLSVGESLVFEAAAPADLEKLAKKLAKQLDDATATFEKVAPKSATAAAAAGIATAEKGRAEAELKLRDAERAHEAAEKKLDATAPADQVARRRAQADLDDARDKKNGCQDAHIEAARAYDMAKRALHDARLDHDKKLAEARLPEDQAFNKAFANFAKADATYGELVSVLSARARPLGRHDAAEVALVKERLEKVRALVTERLSADVAALFKKR